MVGLVQAQRNGAPLSGGWGPTCRWRSWVIDWWDADDLDMVIEIPGQPSREMRRRRRTWYIYAPGTAYRGRGPRGDQRHETAWFFWDFLEPWPTLSTRPLTAILDQDERLAAHVHAMFDLQQQAEATSRLTIEAHALTVFAEILAASLRGHTGLEDDPWPVRAPTGGHARAETLLARLDREVMRVLSQPPTIDELASRLQQSPSTLAHAFKRETGMTVMARVRWLRIRESRRLLMEDGASVKSVARKLGFSSQFHFSQVFRDLTGITAVEFLRQRGA